MQYLDTILSIVASLVAIIIAILSYRKSSHTEKRILRTARLSAKLDREIQPQHARFTLVIENNGETEARNIKTMIDGKPLLEHPVIPQNEKEITQIGPHSFIRYNMAVTMGQAGPYDIEINWEDDSKELGFYSTILTL